MLTIPKGAPMNGFLSKESIALIVNLCEMAGKMQGVPSYTALGKLLGELEKFEEVGKKDEPEAEELEIE